MEGAVPAEQSALGTAPARAWDLAFGTSRLFELIQLFTGLGGFDVDLILNVLGGLLGWLALTVIQRSGLLARLGLTQTSQRGSV